MAKPTTPPSCRSDGGRDPSIGWHHDASGRDFRRSCTRGGVRFWANLLGYQAAWFAVAWSAGRGVAGIGIAACLAFVAWQFATSTVRRDDAWVLAAALACGWAIDSVLALTGWVRYASPDPGLPAPLWILALWGAFALTINHSLAGFARRPGIAALFAALAGPMAYLGAARGFGALTFASPPWPALAWLAVAWALAFPALLRLGAGATPESTRAAA